MFCEGDASWLRPPLAARFLGCPPAPAVRPRCVSRPPPARNRYRSPCVTARARRRPAIAVVRSRPACAPCPHLSVRPRPLARPEAKG